MNSLQDRLPFPRKVIPTELVETFERLYAEWDRGPSPPVRIEFYPYSSLRHTLRVRDGVWLVRLSDLLETAPPRVLEAILAILTCKLRRRRVPPHYRRCYQQHVTQPQLRQAAREVRASRGRKVLTSPRGRVFDLAGIFRRLNHRYFENRVEVDHLSWSREKAQTRLGHYDPAHRAIVINRRLDHPLVPEYVVAFIVYHEMLHASLGEHCRNGRRHFHHAEFRRAEKRFADYRRAQRFIRRELP